MNNPKVYIDDSELSFNSIFLFIQILIKRKFLFIFFIILTILTSLAFVYFSNKNNTVTLKFFPVTDSYILKFNEINNYEANEVNEFSFPDVSKSKLFFNFAKNFKSDVFFSELKKRYDIDNLNINSNEKNIIINQIAEVYSLNMSPNINPDVNIVDIFNNKDIMLELKFISDDINKDREFLKKVIPAVEDKILNDYHMQIDEYTNILNDMYVDQEILLEEKLSTMNYNENLRTKSYIANLKKHAEIAKKLELDIPALKYMEDLNLEIPNPLYFRGYVAIEKEIELLENNSPRVFDVETSNIQTQLELLKRRGDLERFINITEKTPFFADKFKSINYNLDTLLIEPISNRNTIIIVVLLGLLLSFVTPYIVEKYAQYRNKS